MGVQQPCSTCMPPTGVRAVDMALLRGNTGLFVGNIGGNIADFFGARRPRRALLQIHCFEGSRILRGLLL